MNINGLMVQKIVYNIRKTGCYNVLLTAVSSFRFIPTNQCSRSILLSLSSSNIFLVYL